MTSARAKEFCQIADALFTKRGPLDSLCQTIAENVYPLRADFTSAHTIGESFADHLSESFPILAHQKVSDFFSSMLRPTKRQWFMPTTGDEDLDQDTKFRQGLEYVGGVMKRAMYDRAAQFKPATKTTDYDYTAFGNAVMTVEDYQAPTGQRHLLYRNWHFRDVVWLEDGAGKVDTVYRRFKMTAHAMLKRPGWKVSDKVERAAKKDPSTEFDLLHIKVLADAYDGKKPSNRSHRYMSIYVDKSNMEILSEQSSRSLGYIVPRWHRVPPWQYAFSPITVTALPDARMLQDMARVIQEAAEYQVDPAMIATAGAVIRDDVNIYPGGVTWIEEDYDERLGSGLRAFDRSGNIPVGLEMKQDTREMISQAFRLNVLQLPLGQGMTATEVIERIEEHARAVLPLFEPVDDEYNTPMLDETFDILADGGAFQPERMEEFGPDFMDWFFGGNNLQFAYDNPLQDSEGRKRVAQFQEVLALSAGAAEAQQAMGDQSPINLDQAFRDAVRGTGAPADWERSEDEIQATQQNAAMQAEIASVLETVSAGAQVAEQAGNAAKAMGEGGLI